MARKKLKDIAGSSEELEAGLIYNGERHSNYRTYITMEEALNLLISGEMYLSNGKKWNDVTDRNLMGSKNVFAKCFSCSTRENIAMWMLYGGDGGKTGAALNFTGSMLKRVIAADTIELVKCSKKGGEMEVVKKLSRKENDFRVFLTDILYVEELKDKKRMLITQGEEHEIVSKSFMENADKMIFYKDYAWHYEMECRLVVKIDPKHDKLIESADTEDTYPAVRIKLSNSTLSELKKRLTRSPIYNGKSTIGKPSVLHGNVDWIL